MGELTDATTASPRSILISKYRLMDSAFDLKLKEFERRKNEVYNYPKNQQFEMDAAIYRKEKDFIEKYLRSKQVEF